MNCTKVRSDSAGLKVGLGIEKCLGWLFSEVIIRIYVVVEGVGGGLECSMDEVTCLLMVSMMIKALKVGCGDFKYGKFQRSVQWIDE